MSKGKRRESSRISNDIYSHLSNPNDDESRYKIKRVKSRKKLRKIQRKEAKRLKHEKKLEWIKRRKNANNMINSSHKNVVKPVNTDANVQNNGLKSIYKPESNKGLKSDKKVRFDSDHNIKSTPEDIEIEYLERQLLKNKPNVRDKNDTVKRGRKVDVLQELKSEFLRDGFDEDFLDFLSNITTIADEENILDNEQLYPENNTLVKLRNYTLDQPDYQDLTDDEVESEDERHEDEDEDELDVDDDEQIDEDGDEDNEEQLEEDEVFDPSDVIKKQIGMVNRLSEGNYTVIVNQLCEMYSKIISKGSENQVINELFDNLCDVVITMIINEVNVVISLVATQSALICSLSNYFNSSIVKRFVSKLLEKLESNLELMLDSDLKQKSPVNENKLVVRNIIISICSIYYYEVIDIDVIFHLIKLLTKTNLNEDILQLLLILLKYSGQSINKNSEILGYLNDLIEKYKKEHEEFSNRVKFIEEELKSNKKSKNVLEQFDHLKNMIKSKLNMDRVTINLESIINCNNNSDGADGNNSGVTEFETKIAPKKNSRKDELIKKATKIGLNKDIQKTIFICIMDSISPENALDNILKIKLKTQQFNEVINIVIYCYLVEKEFNYYYIKLLLILTSKLNLNVCKKYKRHINNNIVLYFKNFESLTQNQFSLLSKLFYHMILNKISGLRLLNFINVNHFKTSSFKIFINKLFSSIVTTEADDELEEYLIQELLSIKTEKYFNDLASLWTKHIESHCRAKVEKSNSSDILFKSYQRVFKS
ncbi:hypothetical protein TpMuguga_01g02475 [Theileria parva strain Muguga]|uniref:uncharacterized protein n=1 Tax=Theileria parva strain Muguga TaxID=333668 RepID=UPI001C618597|nr:uncharacterized protein TpMuguga_01g02475 [Theileria parva strain Muguga]KAF5153372.1 hypothetical protein TpMuguga_01g02475 [Theileria parva strain Muguga]